jgi:histidinol phosphatase-like PHP family hydrolase
VPKPRTRTSDVNALVAGWLRDLAFVQVAREKRFAFKRAAESVWLLDRPLTDLVEGGGLGAKIPGVGPSSTRVILEVLEAGDSVRVDRVIAESGKGEEVVRRRALRRNFLSRAEVLRVLADRRLGGPDLADYRGDFQMHSEWSDGRTSIAAMAAACRARGYRRCAITDHSHGLRIAGGISMDDAARQHREIDGLNATLAPEFRIVKGIEANIDADGELDIPAEGAPAFEIVLAAPHAKLRLAEPQTARLLRAIEHPAVRILAHPTGRKIDTRVGIVADWAAVFRRAAALGVAVEIDGDPSRQDLHYELAGLALEAGCHFALDSDAHGPGQLHYADTAIAHARLAGIPPARIVNCWPDDRFDRWLDDRSAGR